MAKTTTPTMDISALKTFQSVWGPVVASIPAVIDMAENFADVERALTIKRKELDDVMAKVDKAMDDGNARYAELQGKISDAGEKLSGMNAKVQEEQSKVAQAIKAAQDAGAVEIAKAKADTKNEIAGIRAKVKDAAAELEALRAEKAAAVADAQAKLDDIEKRVASAEKSLASLRAKLG